MKEFKDAMQNMTDKSQVTISVSSNFDDGKEIIISEPPTEEFGAEVIDKPAFAPLHLACSDDELRFNLMLIRIKNNIATATNGLILVKMDLSKTTKLDIETLKMLDGKNIHKEVWKEIHKATWVQFFDDQIDCHKNGIKKTFYYSAADGELWDDKTIVLDVKEAGEEPKRIMTYNANLIKIIAQIFQEPQLTFSFSKNNKGTIVFPYEDSGMFAILMPIYQTGVSLNRYMFY